MTSVVSTVTGTSSAAPAPSSAVSTATTSVLTSKAQTQAPSISPRIVADPVVGIITEYLDRTGKITSQIPSAVIVAYLKAGLTQDGFAKPLTGAGSGPATALA